MNKKIRLQEPSYGEEEINDIIDLLRSTMVVMGEKTTLFQNLWCKWQNCNYATMVNSGSSANLLIMHLLKSKYGKYQLKDGDEVLVPAVTWSTTLFPIIQLGLQPILVDVNPKTFNIDIDSCKKALTARTKAVFVVHLLGNPCNMDEIRTFCEENKLVLVEDCCEALGAKWNNIKVGNFGLASSYSFMFAHHISTIEGGMVNSSSELDDNILKSARAHGWIRDMNYHMRERVFKESGFDDPRFVFWDLGFNVRPTEISSIFGIYQLKRVDEFIQTRNDNFHLYEEEFRSISDKIQIQELEDSHKVSRSNFAFGFYIKDTDAFKRSDLINYLSTYSIESRPMVAGNLARHPFYSLYCQKPEFELSNSDKIHFGGLYLPNHQNLNADDISYVASIVKKFFLND